MVVNLLLFMHLFCSRCGTWIRGWINCDCSVVHNRLHSSRNWLLFE